MIRRAKTKGIALGALSACRARHIFPPSFAGMTLYSISDFQLIHMKIRGSTIRTNSIKEVLLAALAVHLSVSFE